MPGYIKLYRKLLENPIMKKPGMLQLWIYCLLRANHESGKVHFGGDEIDIQPGQFITGRFELSDALGEKPSTIYKRISALTKTGFLNTKSNNKNTLVTIVNWELYQSAEVKSSSKGDNKVTTKEQQSSTNKNDKNDKNDKKNISVFTPPTLDQVKIYCRERNNQVDPEKFVDFYSSKGWMVGKNKMKDWQASVRTWEKEKNKPPGKVPEQFTNFKQRKYDKDHFNKFYEEV
jgi:hypothetical protein